MPTANNNTKSAQTLFISLLSTAIPNNTKIGTRSEAKPIEPAYNISNWAKIRYNDIIYQTIIQALIY
jgi:hypothetical protein